jgi:phage regulator Rha-like protein
VDKLIINEESIKNKIYTIRGIQVMLDSDLAELYGVETRIFNQAVKRNIKRFPESFRFQLNEYEYNNLRSQFVTSSLQHGGRRYLPYVFTEQGVSMLSAILKSDIAIEISIKIIETFVAMRKYLASNSLMFARFERIEQRLSQHDDNFSKIFKAIEDKSIKPTQGIFYDGQIFDN